MTFIDLTVKGKETHLDLELKVLVLPLPAENVTRNANPNGLLEAVEAGAERTGRPVLRRKARRKRRKRRKGLAQQDSYKSSIFIVPLTQ